MRHKKKKTTLGRESAPRKALLKNLAQDLILREKIKTTKAKAKAVRPIVEKLITTSKANTLAARRLLIKRLYTQNAVRKLMDDLGPRYKDRNGGYTRIINVGERKGDGAFEAIIELV